MKNMIYKWAGLIDESFNPDNYKSDKFDHDSDKWEELKSQIAEINKKLDKKEVKEAEDDEDDGEIDPEIERLGKTVDDVVSDLDRTSKRNDRMADQVPDDYDPEADDNEDDDSEDGAENGPKALKSGKYGQEVAKLKAVGGADEKYWVQFRMIVDYPNLKASERDYVNNFETLNSIPVSEDKNVRLFNVVPTNSIEEAKQKVEQTVNNPKMQKWLDGAKLQDFKTEWKDMETGEVHKRTPKKILKVDEDAIEFFYSNTTVKDKSDANIIKQRGPKSDDGVDYDKKDKIVTCSFFIYKAFAPIPFNDRQDKFFEQILKEFDPEQYEKIMDRRENEKDYNRVVSQAEKDAKDADEFGKTGDAEELASDDEIERAAAGEKGRSIDGYSTRSDDDGEEDNHEDIRGRSRSFGNYNDDDPDDYENAQYQRGF